MPNVQIDITMSFNSETAKYGAWLLSIGSLAIFSLLPGASDRCGACFSGRGDSTASRASAPARWRCGCIGRALSSSCSAEITSSIARSLLTNASTQCKSDLIRRLLGPQPRLDGAAAALDARFLQAAARKSLHQSHVLS